MERQDGDTGRIVYLFFFFLPPATIVLPVPIDISFIFFFFLCHVLYMVMRYVLDGATFH